MILLRSIATPMVWVLLLLTAGLVLARLRRKKSLSAVAWYVLLAGTVLLWTLSLAPVANLLTYPLESRYAPASNEVLATLDVVVVLGSGVLPSGRFRPEAELTAVAYPRLYRGVKAFQRSGANLLAFCGGRFREGMESEAEVMAAMAGSMGVAEDKILQESHSRNTMENAARLARRLPPGRDRRIGLVTTATHMWRSESVFKKQFPHDTIVPIAVYYTYDPVVWRSTGNITPSVGALEKSTVALHEWIGLIWYALRYR